MPDVLHESSKRVETLLERFSAYPAATGAHSDAEELVRTVSALYGEGLRRIVAAIRQEPPHVAETLLRRCCADPVVASLLITHGLHPVPLEERVRSALAGIDGVEPISIDEDRVELRIDGFAERIPAIERAVRAAAPEVLDVHAVGQTISLLGVQ